MSLFYIAYDYYLLASAPGAHSQVGYSNVSCPVLGSGRVWRETAGGGGQGAEQAEGGDQPAQRAPQLDEPPSCPR